MAPSVGRIVHYYTPENEGPFAAIVTHVRGEEGAVDLQVFPRTHAPSIMLGVPMNEKVDCGAHRWVWPPRV